MAIDDNTLYGLTGAQVKELPEKINAVKGQFIELTADDYDYPDSAPTGIALWRLPTGAYRVAPNIMTYDSSASSLSLSGVFLVNQLAATSGEDVIVISAYGGNGGASTRLKYTCTYYDGQVWSDYSGHFIPSNEIVDALTSTSSTRVLSAKQGKVLKDLIDSLVISGAGAPTTSTVGTVGQLYQDTTNGKLYICTDATNPYVWEEVGGGSAINVVQTTGTSTTDVMSQNATTSMVFSDPANKNIVRIGNGATSGSRATHSVTIGHNAKSAQEADIVIGYAATNYNTGSISGNNVIIGRQTYVAGSAAYGVVIGLNSYLTGSCTYGVALGVSASVRANYGIALGGSAQVSANYGIALGSYSNATEKGQVDISTSATTNTYGYNNSQYRLLTGLYDPQNNHDAATKGYVDGMITLTDTDPGEGATLAAGKFIAVYDSNS